MYCERAILGKANFVLLLLTFDPCCPNMLALLAAPDGFILPSKIDERCAVFLAGVTSGEICMSESELVFASPA